MASPPDRSANGNAPALDRLFDVARAFPDPESFHRELVQGVCMLLGADVGMVGLRDAAAPRRMRTIALAIDGRVAANIDYPLAGTPCETVLEGTGIVVSSDAAASAADDHPWRAWGINGYAGAPLMNSRGAVVGVLAALYRKSLRADDALPEMLKALAYRASVELDRAAAEEDARHTRTLLEQFADNASEIVAIASVAPEAIVFINPAYERVTGRSCESLLSDPRSWRALIHPSDRERIERAYERAAGGTPFLEEYRIVRDDGSSRWMRHRSLPIRDESGATSRLVCIIEDITESRRIEQEREHLDERRRQAQKLEALSTLSAGLAHDFSNVVTAILGHVDLARTASNDPAQYAQSLGSIELAAREASEIVRSLMLFSRGEPLAKEPVDIGELVRDVERMLGPTLPANMTLETRVPVGLTLRVHGNAGQLRRVLLNLALNARDAMPSGGRLRLDLCCDPEVDPTVVQSGKPVPTSSDRLTRAVLAVTDQGTGMTPEIRSRIFDPFFTTKTRGAGTGLGLSIASGVVKDHRGTLEVESQEGLGTRVCVSLPCTVHSADQAPDAAQMATRRGSSERILVGEDNRQVRAILDAVLTSAGYRVVQASTGDEVLRHLAAPDHGIRALIVDADLPTIDGVMCARRAMQGRSKIPVILISGMDVALDDLVAEGVRFFRKPFSMSVLVDELGQLLRPPIREAVSHGTHPVAAGG